MTSNPEGLGSLEIPSFDIERQLDSKWMAPSWVFPWFSWFLGWRTPTLILSRGGNTPSSWRNQWVPHMSVRTTQVLLKPSDSVLPFQFFQRKWMEMDYTVPAFDGINIRLPHSLLRFQLFDDVWKLLKAVLVLTAKLHSKNFTHALYKNSLQDEHKQHMESFPWSHRFLTDEKPLADWRNSKFCF